MFAPLKRWRWLWLPMWLWGKLYLFRYENNKWKVGKLYQHNNNLPTFWSLKYMTFVPKNPTLLHFNWIAFPPFRRLVFIKMSSCRSQSDQRKTIQDTWLWKNKQRTSVVGTTGKIPLKAWPIWDDKLNGCLDYHCFHSHVYHVLISFS